MSDESKEDFRDFHIITIVYDEDSYAPEIDLGNCSAELAIAIFSRAIDVLESIQPLPRIKQNGEVITSELFYDGDDDDFA